MKVSHINDRVRNVKNDIIVIIISTQMLVFNKKRGKKGANCMNSDIFSLRSSEAYWSSGQKPAVKKRWGSFVAKCNPPKTTTTTKLCVLNIILCVLILSLFHGTAGDVSRGAGGDSGRHRTHTVRKDPGAAFQTDLQMCLQPTFPGQWWLIVPFLTMPTFPVGWGWPNLYHGEYLCLNSYWLLKGDKWVVIDGMKTWLS